MQSDAPIIIAPPEAENNDLRAAREMLYHLNNPCGFGPVDRAEFFLRYAASLISFHDAAADPAARALYQEGIRGLPERLASLRGPIAYVLRENGHREVESDFLRQCDALIASLTAWLGEQH